MFLFLYQTPDNFEADFNEIIKREEEESGLCLSSSAEKTPRRVRTSLEEKYAKLSKTSTAVSSASVSRIEEQQDAIEQQNPVITVVGALLWYCILMGDLINFLLQKGGWGVVERGAYRRIYSMKEKRKESGTRSSLCSCF